MSKIQEYLEQIRLARYGKDVRQAIHDAIHQCYEDGKAGEVDLIAREGVVSLREDVTEMQEDISKVHEDIAALDSKAEALEIKTTKENTIKNTKHGGFRLTKMLANTVQNGTPSPSTPFPLLSTGDCVDMINGQHSFSNGAYATSNVYVTSKNPIPCKSGYLVKIKLDEVYDYVGFCFYGSNGFIAPASSGSRSEYEFTAPSGTTHFTYNVGKANGLTVDTVSKVQITINGKYLNVVKTRTKNVFDNGFFADNNYYSANGKSLIVNKQDSRQYNAIKTFLLKPNTTYTLSVQNACALYFGKDFEGSMAADGLANTLTFTTTNSGISHFKFLAPSYPYDVGIVQLEEGTEATPIEPFGETVAYYLTQYPMIKGSTLFRENGLVKAMHTMKAITLDNFMQYAQYAGNPSTYYMVASDMATGGEVKFSHLRYKYACWESADDIGCFSNHINSYIVYFNTGHETLEDFYVWTRDNLPTLQYELATPIIETLDTASQTALNGLETFDGVTYVEFDTRIPPLEFEAEYGISQVGAYTLKALNNSESSLVNDADNKARIEDAISTMLLIGA